jgi:hypothetical protein
MIFPVRSQKLLLESFALTFRDQYPTLANIFNKISLSSNNCVERSKKFPLYNLILLFEQTKYCVNEKFTAKRRYKQTPQSSLHSNMSQLICSVSLPT